MKIITYYLLLLVFIGLLAGFLIQNRSADMSMKQMVSISVMLVLYVVAISVVGEGKVIDERELSHRYIANRLALIAGTVVISMGILFQLFSHKLDYWLLAGLVAINLVKIMSLIYSNHNR